MIRANRWIEYFVVLLRETFVLVDVLDVVGEKAKMYAATVNHNVQHASLFLVAPDLVFLNGKLQKYHTREVGHPGS